MQATDEHLRGILIVTTGILVLSFDALLIRLAQTGSWNVVFWRGAFIALSLALFLAFREGRRFIEAFRAGGWMAFVSAVLFSLTGLLFVFSVMQTKVANTVVIVSAAPLFAALFTRLFLAEAVRFRTWAAIVATFAGVVVVFYGSIGAGGLLGDVLALITAIILGANVTVLRRHPELRRIPLVCLSGVITALIALPFAEPLGLTWESYGILAIMGLVQMPVAMVLMAVGTRYLSAPEVSLFLLLEAVFGPIWVWLAVGEEPPEATFLGGGIVIAALVVHSWLGLSGRVDKHRASTKNNTGQ